ncbi:MAG TPA: chemotaxis-specific protein-glutamate methyltransferase CheB [Spirochaetia bacterium]|nr:chemotaxis-specific protein-glutamate methyltransferase CheB [Spirochaetia bacterium]
MVRLLIVEDSPVARSILLFVLGSDPEIQVVGSAADGSEAIEMVERLKPDVVTMDINMPKMNGLEATRKIMQTRPVPIIIVSGSYDTSDIAATFQAVDAGAVAVLPRPYGIGNPMFQTQAYDLVRTVKLMAEVKVIHRIGNVPALDRSPAIRTTSRVGKVSVIVPVRFIAIGASTGGPIALRTILGMLPRDFPIPIGIVQHMAPGFITGFVTWLSQACSRTIRVANQGDPIEPENIYIAPDDAHLKIERGNRLVLTQDAPVNGLRPAVSTLFRSVADAYGAAAAGVLLTGMGKDGACELGLMKELGAVTIAQDEASSIVYGMPGEAVRIGAARYELPLDEIATALTQLAGQSL